MSSLLFNKVALAVTGFLQNLVKSQKQQGLFLTLYFVGLSALWEALLSQGSQEGPQALMKWTWALPGPLQGPQKRSSVEKQCLFFIVLQRSYLVIQS